MPLYDYSCADCGHEIEVRHGVHDPGPESCERCGGRMRKLMSSPSIVFKGSGWAKKDAHDSRSSAPAAKAADGAPEQRPSGATESARDDGKATAGESKPSKAAADKPAGGGTGQDD